MSNIVERIEWKLKEKGISFRQLERDCKLGNGTVRRWNGQSPQLNKLVVVAAYLQVSLDYLAFGYEVVSEETPEGMGNTLTTMEHELVSMFRSLPPEEQEDFYAFLQIKYKRYQNAAQPPEGDADN